MIDIINVSSRGQIVIPEKIRKRFRLRQGSKLILIEKENCLILKRGEEIAEQTKIDDQKEFVGWISLAEQSLKEIWDNPKDDKIWQKYL